MCKYNDFGADSQLFRRISTASVMIIQVLGKITLSTWRFHAKHLASSR